MCGDNPEGGHDDAEGLCGDIDEFAVEDGLAFDEYAGDFGGEDFADDGAQGCGAEGADEGHFECLPDAVVLFGAVVVGDDGLHALRESEDDHEEEDGDAIDDGEGADVEVVSVFEEVEVLQHDDEASGGVGEEVWGADGEHVPDEGRGGAELVFFDVDGFVAFEEDGDEDGAAGDFGEHSGECGALDAEFEPVDEDGG